MKIKQMHGLIAAFVLSACSHAPFMATEHVRENLVRDKASFDLNCERQEIAVTRINDSSYGAKGCNKQASYVLLNCQSDLVSGNFASECQIVLESAKNY